QGGSEPAHELAARAHEPPTPPMDPSARLREEIKNIYVEPQSDAIKEKYAGGTKPRERGLGPGKPFIRTAERFPNAPKPSEIRKADDAVPEEELAQHREQREAQRRKPEGSFAHEIQLGSTSEKPETSKDHPGFTKSFVELLGLDGG